LFFFKDGIRELTFLKGLNTEEFEDFIKILNTDFENTSLDDDIVTLFWERDFEHIKYLVDEDVLSDEESQSYEKIYEEIKNKACSDDNLAKAFNDGLEAKETPPSTLVPISDDDFKHIAADRERKKMQHKIDKIITILYELIFNVKEKLLFSEIVNFIESALDYCIKAGDFKRSCFILDSVKSIIGDKAIEDENIRALEKIYATISSEPFIREIGEVIDSKTLIEEKDFMTFLKHLNKTSIPSFIEIMGELKSIRGRRLVIDALVILGKLDIKTIAKGLNDSRWFVVRNIISILGKIADAGSIEFLTKIMSHPDQRVRKEVIKTIGNIGSLNILQYIEIALNDEDSSVRIAAVKTLGNTKTEPAKKVLMAELSSKDFPLKELTEKKDFYEVIANWQDQDVKDFLLSALNRKTFFWNKKADEIKACAANALGMMGDKEAIPFLEKAKNTRNALLKNFATAAIKRLTS
ncbi:MAG: HEAT repeat domain-containing protein, partial [Nitrospirota bacterium]